MHSYADNGSLSHEFADHLIRCTTDDHNVRYGTDPSELSKSFSPILLDSLCEEHFYDYPFELVYNLIECKNYAGFQFVDC